ncbi:MmcQ/YjbR family DNA-binding protein [Flavobacterium caeni]|uniref:Predicted DNA-binding protein, MmcQ/YjbR family n=1 Tax=Flavobacterium caeni TaxID=490189 RepID=A0A1G5GE40_9FLAO|nr:MmcQ/YjbR family DNA-binding protein [Flavobacterium caeni]SCY49852.1 Predicted DNA-binding protein, MmcQ/YjbR family [Flavobacterium caeni]
MDIQDYFDYCRAKKGVTEHFPFDEDTLVFKVGGKMFALSSLKEWENGTPSVNLKCDPDKALELRARYNAVEPGYHMSKIHWNTVAFHADVDDKTMCRFIDDSYDLVVKSLTKKARAELDQLGN